MCPGLRLFCHFERGEGTVTVRKCVSHLDAESIVATNQQHLDLVGNEVADAVAGLGAEQAGQLLRARGEVIVSLGVCRLVSQ